LTWKITYWLRENIRLFPPLTELVECCPIAFSKISTNFLKFEKKIKKFHKCVLCPRQSYWVEVSCICSWSRPNTTVRGHNTGVIWKYPFYDTFINQWLQITAFFFFFRCGHNYTADQNHVLVQSYWASISCIYSWPRPNTTASDIIHTLYENIHLITL
jgi:hypothetical protein